MVAKANNVQATFNPVYVMLENTIAPKCKNHQAWVNRMDRLKRLTRDLNFTSKRPALQNLSTEKQVGYIKLTSDNAQRTVNGLRPWKPAHALYICKSDYCLNMGSHRYENEDNWTKTKMDESNSDDEYCKFSLIDTHEYRDNKNSVLHNIFEL